MKTQDKGITIEEAAELIESSGSYKWIEIESLVETDGHFLCKLKGPSHRSKTGFTYYPPMNRDTKCATKKEAILLCLQHIASMGAMGFYDADEKVEDNRSDKKSVLSKKQKAIKPSSTEETKEPEISVVSPLASEEIPIQTSLPILSDNSATTPRAQVQSFEMVDNSSLPLLF